MTLEYDEIAARMRGVESQMGSLEARLTGYEAAASLLALIADPTSAKTHLEQLRTAEAAANAAQAAAEQAREDLDETASALDQREAALRQREVAVYQAEQHFGDDAKLKRIDAALETLRRTDEQLRRRAMKHAGLDTHFIEALQALPSWDDIDRALEAPKDEEFDPTTVTVVDEERKFTPSAEPGHHRGVARRVRADLSLTREAEV